MSDTESDEAFGESADRAVEQLKSNDVAEFVMQSVYGDVPTEPCTLSGEFPGSKDRAMGHAREVAEIAREHDLDAEVEYVGEVENFDLHRIDVHLNGGDPSE